MARNRYDVDEELDSPFDIKHLKRCWVYIKRYKRLIITAIILSIVANVSLLTVPQLLRFIIDVGIPNGDRVFIVRNSLLILLAISVFITLVRFRMKLMNRAGQSIIADIRVDLYTHLQSLSFNYFDSRPHGKILIRVIQYVNSVTNMLSNGLIDFILETINIVLILTFMFATDWRLALIVLGGLPVFLLIMVIIAPIQRMAWQDFTNKNANIGAYAAENIDGVKVTQMFCREEVNKGIFDTLCVKSKNSWMRAIYFTNISWVSADIISVAIVAIMYGVSVLVFSPPLAFGVISAMAAYTWRFWFPIINLSRLINEVISTVAFLERIFELMDEPVEIVDGEGAEPIKEIIGEVEFDHVMFEYEKGYPILEDLCFTVTPGESIALVGPTGAGKTTIVNLISRFYNLTSGAVLIDGQDISNVTLNSLRSQMGIMLQDSFIFSGTVADNVRYGKLDATMDEIKIACEAVRANEFIEELPLKYETVLEEGGSNLSQGEKQLISFARTLISNPKILILDEATSSIDTRTEKLLQEGLEKLLENRTSFIIAHRLSTIKRCDRILYIADKGIVEQGNHDDLLAQKGAYYKLYTTHSV